MMKKLWIFLLGLALMLMWSCESGVQNTPADSYSQHVYDVKLISAVNNGDGSYTYTWLLPRYWDDNLNQDEGWGIPGIQLNDGDIQDLAPDPGGLDAYIFTYTGPNADVFINYGRPRFVDGKPVWANEDRLSQSKYYIVVNGKKYLGITVRNGGISPVDPASMVQLQAIIDVNPIEVRINTNIVFSGARSTGQALYASKITDYAWDFGDGATASGQVVNHSYAGKGDYNVKLTVTDNLGNVNSAVKVVHIWQMSFPPNTMEGGDDYVQVLENRYNKTITIYVNLSLTHGNHGRPFFWGTVNGIGTAWEFVPIQPVPLNEDWGYIVVPFSGREQFEFNYSDYFDYLNGDNRPVGVNWDHMPFSKFYDPLLGHYNMLVANQKISRPY